MPAPVPLTTFAKQPMTEVATEVHFVDAYPPPPEATISAMQKRAETEHAIRARGGEVETPRLDGLGLWVACGSRGWLDGNRRLAGSSWLAVVTHLELKQRIAARLSEVTFTDERKLLLAAARYNLGVFTSPGDEWRSWVMENEKVIDVLRSLGPAETCEALED